MGSPEGTVVSTGRNAGIAKQVISSAIVSVGSLLGGMGQGWTSPMTLQLKKEDSPVGRMTTEEIANLTAIPSYFGLVLGLSIIIVANKWGRKPALIVAGVPTIVAYIIIMLATSQVMLYIGKILAGFCNLGVTLSQMYVSETTHESIRGILMAACTMQINVGILVGYILGKYLDYKWFNFVYAVVPAVYVALMLFIPETPYFLVEKSKDDEAKKSLLWLRGGDVRLAEEELAIIKNRESDDTEEKLTFLQELKTRATKIAMVVSVLGYAFQSLSGIYAVINFAGVIFEEAGSPLEANDSAIVTAVLNLVASFMNLLLIDRFGRKPLLYISFIGGAVSLSILTVFLYILQNGGMDISHVGWIPIGSLGTFIFCYGIGLASVPGVLMNEMTPTNVNKPLWEQ
uniref:Facilitated trehalose transporter Tret1 n=1 Tax=Lygus hesperus TaxID=30085 RepID=A0A0A9VQH4_LYGHE